MLAVIGVATGLSALGSASTQGRPGVVATHAIASGTVIEAADLTVVNLPDAALPQEAFGQVSDVVGRQALSDIPQRGIVVESNLLSGELTGTTGLLKLPVHFADNSAVSLLHRGQHIDVFGPTGSGGGFALVASDITVLAIPQGDQGGPWGTDTASLVVIEVDPTQAANIAAAASSTSLSFALR